MMPSSAIQKDIALETLLNVLTMKKGTELAKLWCKIHTVEKVKVFR